MAGAVAETEEDGPEEADAAMEEEAEPVAQSLFDTEAEVLEDPLALAEAVPDPVKDPVRELWGVVLTVPEPVPEVVPDTDILTVAVTVSPVGLAVIDARALAVLEGDMVFEREVEEDRLTRADDVLLLVPDELRDAKEAEAEVVIVESLVSLAETVVVTELLEELVGIVV